MIELSNNVESFLLPFTSGFRRYQPYLQGRSLLNDFAVILQYLGGEILHSFFVQFSVKYLHHFIKFIGVGDISHKKFTSNLHEVLFAPLKGHKMIVDFLSELM